MATNGSKSAINGKEDLAQVNPQLFEWLRIINAKSSVDMIAQKNDSVKRGRIIKIGEETKDDRKFAN